MDPALLGIAPNLGAVGVLLVTISILFKQNHADRNQSMKALAQVEAQAVEEMKNRDLEHTAALERLGKQLKDMQESFNDVLALLDTERHKRWTAEDLAAGYRRRLELIEGKSL